MMDIAKSNQELLDLKENHLQILAKVNKGKMNVQIVEDSQKELVTVSNQLWKNERWGVVFLDYSEPGLLGYLFNWYLSKLHRQIMQSQPWEKIKLHFARNMSVFHLADTLNDTLHMLLIAVKGLPAKEAMDFIQTKLNLWSITEDRASMNNMANNTESILIFSQLLTVSMLQKSPIINFNNLYNWRKITLTWLDHFLSFAVISFEYLGLNPGNDINADFFETAIIGGKQCQIQLSWLWLFGHPWIQL